MRRLLLLLITLLLLTSAAGAARTPRDGENPFGIVEGFWMPDLVCELGAGWERIIFDWSAHQPTGPDDWHTLNVDDRWLKAANDCDREIVAIVKNTPAWATDGLAGPGVPRGLDLPIDDPGNLWANFMRRTASYYASRGVHRFIILNEPDIDRETFGFEFEGTLEDYFLMLKVAYLAAKEGNPSAVIHIAATTYWHDANKGNRLYMDRLLERITQDPEAAANDHYFDVFSLHIYFRTETIPQIVGIMRELLESNGLGHKAIWINEMNAAPNIDPDWPVVRPQFQVDLEMQAAFLVQAAALALASDVERMAVYKLWDQALPEGGESFGILNPASQAPRPAFYAWQTVIDRFSGVDFAQMAASDTADVVHMRHEDGRQTFVAWARTESPTVVEIDALSDKAYLVDQYGGSMLLRPVDGRYRLPLPGTTCDADEGCFIGGPVSILVQEGAVIDREAAVVELTSSRATTLEFE